MGSTLAGTSPASRSEGHLASPIEIEWREWRKLIGNGYYRDMDEMEGVSVQEGTER
jgi:hypothetical protein